MKESISSLATMALLALSSTLTTNAATQVYDLKADWSDTQNPNGTWSYLEGTNLLHSGFVSNYFPPIPAWVGVDNVAPAIFKISGELIVQGACASCGEGAANILWTAPSTGRISISGDVSDYNGFGGDGNWSLSHNGNSLSEGHFTGAEYIPGYSLFYFSIGSGGASVLQNIPVAAGDQVVLELGGIPIDVNFTITFTPDAVDPVAAIEDLALTVVHMNLQNGIENSLDSKLDAAINALIDANVNNDGAACNSLAAFISAVQAQRGKKITNAQADQLIAAAQQIKAMLNCGN